MSELTTLELFVTTKPNDIGKCEKVCHTEEDMIQVVVHFHKRLQVSKVNDVHPEGPNWKQVIAHGIRDVNGRILQCHGVNQQSDQWDVIQQGGDFYNITTQMFFSARHFELIPPAEEIKPILIMKP